MHNATQSDSTKHHQWMKKKASLVAVVRESLSNVAFRSRLCELITNWMHLTLCLITLRFQQIRILHKTHFEWHSYRSWFSREIRLARLIFWSLVHIHSLSVQWKRFSFGVGCIQSRFGLLLITETHRIVQLVQKVWQLKWTGNKIDNLTFVRLQQWQVI